MNLNFSKLNYGCTAGLNLAWNVGYRCIKVELDSREALILIEKQRPASHHLMALVADINSLINRAWQVDMGHTLREGNTCADFLAKHGTLQEESWCEWRYSPLWISLELLADALGTTVQSVAFPLLL